ncbi:MAG TPA: DUF2218 domain-containing protein [Allosphingosinicella sp.]|nr:DUF2218 domain-containing protein [Allosphingosinicella sp.]
MTNLAATANVPTTSASRYLQQLCKHWTHNLAVTFNAEEGRILFPKDARGLSFPGDGIVTLRAHETGLEVLLAASAPEQLEGLKGAVASHLDRFAFREAPLDFDWR